MIKEDVIRITRSVFAYYERTNNEISWEDRNEAFGIIVKALEQELVLDKIRERVELEKLGYPPSAGYYKAIIKCLKIIDKYKAESEGKE